MGENKDCRVGTMFSTTDANCGRKSFAYKFHNGSVGYTVPCLNYECTLTYISLHKSFTLLRSHRNGYFFSKLQTSKNLQEKISVIVNASKNSSGDKQILIW